MKPAWLKLIEQWQDSHHYGLTIPFLVGALFQEQPGTGLGQLRALLASIRDDAPEGVIMRLYTCDWRHELILAPVASAPTYCLPIPSPTRSTATLYVEHDTVPEAGDPFEGLVTELWGRYRGVIEAEQFSYRDDAFQPFNDDEQMLISAAATRQDEDDV